jgi:bifunctional UDP-N-acetylglucosamine pyrophosphorylase / glucosamine-1-phosphate N-acetyltransferase
MLERVLRLLASVGFERPTVLVGYRSDLVREFAGDRCLYVEQGEQLGTGHAARVSLESLPDEIERLVLIHGDEPLLPPDSIQEMLQLQAQTSAPVVLLTTRVRDTRGFGRVIRNESGDPVTLLQQADLSAEQLRLDEVNLGAYVFDVPFLRAALQQLKPHPPKGEYYLTDVVAIAAERASRNEGRPVGAVRIEGGAEFMGVNDLVQLEEASGITYRKINRRHMLAGVTIVDSASTFIDEDVEIGPDTVVYPFTLLQGRTTIGAGCSIGPHAQLIDSHVGDGSRVMSSMLEEATVGSGVRVGPFAHLRPGAEIGDAAEIGNYAEVKNSVIGPRTRMHHMSYLGDAQVGENVNIGAGTITANYDGRRKHRTVIEDDAFIGTDTMLRAPVCIGTGAVTGAGSVVLKDVAPRTVVAGVPARVIREVVDESEEGPT